MLVQCPNCKTTYKVADEVLKGAAPAFRCSRCRHTFELETEVSPVSPVERREEVDQKASAAAQSQELSFSFPAKEMTEAAGKSAVRPIETTEPARDNAGETPVHDQWSISRSETKDEAPFTMPETSSTDAPQTSLGEAKEFDKEIFPGAPGQSDDDSQSADKVLPMSSYLNQQASILPYLTLFGILVIFFSLLAVISYAHPKASETLLKNIPLIGRSVLKNNHLKDGILLGSLRGRYQSIQGNREVIVITGVAVNQNPVVIREIQVSGRVYNESGKELEQQTIWVGNTLSAKIIRGMTAEDIPHLQSLKPLKSFEMPPGDSVPFAVVFLRSTRSAKDFTCEVALAEGET
jgi:predicted Zn finger-like uncharacterized protein